MNQAHHPQKASIKSIISLCLITAFSFSSSVQAQITPDNTLGTEASQLDPNVLVNGALGDKIDGGATRGGNLFHSFSEFNIENGQRVYFANPTGVENILTRVTGGNASNIFGTLGVDGAANLFLINPNGILFGENAQLDVQGSFVGTTANGVQFGNQGNFSATNPQAPPLLTINPSALLFNQLNQGGITNQSQAPAGINPSGQNVTGLRVADGQNLLLVGGNINLDGGAIRAYGGNIELAALAAPGTVGLNITDNNSANLVIPDDVERADVSLSNSAEVNVRGADGGNIKIHARNVNLTGQSKLRAGIDIGLGTPNSQGGDVVINATGTTTLTELSFIANVIEERAFGKSGDINITTGSLNLVNNSTLNASTYGQGNAGSVLIQAKDGVSLTGGADIKNSVEQGAVGNGGSIEIQTGSLSLTEASEINTTIFGQGNGGNIAINARETISLDGFGNVSNIFSRITSSVNPSGVGNGGDIQLTTGSLAVTNRAFITSGTLGKGDAGNIIIDARDIISFDRDAFADSNVSPRAVGNAGDIQITTGSLAFTNGAFIDSGTYGQGNAGNITINARDTVTFDGVGRDGYYSSANSIAFSNTMPTAGYAYAKGGDIRINARALFLTNGGQLNVFSAGQGNAGSIFLDTSDTVIVDGIGSNGLSSGVNSFATESGNGGEIQVNTGTLSLTNGGNLFSSALRNAGNITINARDAVILDGVAENEIPSGVISYLNSGGIGKGGDIQITTNSLTARNGGVIVSSTFAKGNAGNITINARDTVTLDGVGSNGLFSGVITNVPNQGEGNGGNIDINATSLSLTNGATLATSTSGRGDAGNVNINVTGAIDISGKKNGFTSGIRSFVDTGTVGNGGNIFIDSGSFSVRDGAELTASTSGRGDAGNVNLQVTGAVDIAGEKNGFMAGIRSSVNTRAVGNGGNIFIDSGSFSVRDGAELTTSTFGQGNAGNVTVRASDFVSLTGGNIFSTVEVGGVGQGGNIDINATSLSLTDGSQLITPTYGQGNAGNIRVNAKDAVTVSGTSQENGVSTALFTFTNSTSTGKGGNITVNTNIFRVSEGALLDARTRNNQNGGDVTVNANVFEALNGGQLTTTTSSNGRAGKITVNADDKLIISGIDSNYNDRSTKFPGGRVANIGANSGLFVSSTGSGITGDIEINSPEITLNNQGKLNAESASGNGGNINVNSDLLLLRRGAQISTNAGTEKLGGDGGDININSKFIVAIPDENSDISANAFTGTGGNVEINSQGIFGIESQTKPTEKSDITASSEQGVSGVININAPDTSSIQNSFTELPPVIDTNALIANSCISRGIKRQENSFTITGSGAITTNRPGVLVSTYTTGEVRGVETTSRPWKKGDPIIEPQGLYRLPNGQLILSRSC
ncbi:filamentous hemagglutinin N-terminal domain-containing protein [Nostoc linckia FACHB-391]|uniref:Filamentous hemagglutinin N-terminal domain-containing protein n=1 Tax=Nostoc linckia FACHB-391 TaxID=2692906 RepID=A0ABR8EPG4_NOSLI|nr:filamentous hemagglutinin N-terminal domain-containing protein [Nostoc linckia]MBD2559722.1 filamentous hemagglutinin N-terminal domain-containing protein [Nostoc linckia FACHB-391]